MSTFFVKDLVSYFYIISAMSKSILESTFLGDEENKKK